MRNAGLEIKGINRKVNSSDNDAGYCSELINIRPENGLKVVPEKKEISTDLSFKRIIIHKVANKENYIGFDDNGVVWFDEQNGDVIARLYDSTDELEQIHLATLGNMLVISDKNRVNNVAYIFSNNMYEEYIKNEALDFDINVTHSFVAYDNNPLFELGSTLHPRIYTDEFSLNDLDITNKEDQIVYRQTLQSAYNKFLEINKEYAHGYYLVAVNVTLWDGNETKLSNLQTFIPNDAQIDENVELDFPLERVTATNMWRIDMSHLVTTHSVYISNADLDKYKDFIKSINVYVSKPISSVIFDDVNYDVVSKSYKPLHISKSNIQGQLMYKYKSFSINELKDVNYVQLKFGLDDITTNQTLKVDSSTTTRAGKMFAYNNRLHFYDSVAKVDVNNGIQLKSMDNMATVEFTAQAYMFLRDTYGDFIIKCPDVTLKSISSLKPYVVNLDYMTIVQDSRAYKLVLTYDNTYAELELSASTAYNYAYRFFGTAYFQEGDKYKNITATGAYPEYNAVNVTAPNNPIYFPVEHSYKFDGNITALAVATEAISDTQVGQYPLNVFTDNGIFALEQGNGQVLYSNTVPLSNDVCENKNIIALKGGIAFIANNAVYIISGRQTTKLTELIEGPIDKYIQNNSSFFKCCVNGLYNIQEQLSTVDFKEYLKNANLAWSSIENELIVSNEQYQYSYVYNFTYNSWYKVSGSYQMIGNNIFFKKDNNSVQHFNKIIEWENMPDHNNSQIIHLHTRPVHIQNKNSFKIIHKSVLNCLADINDNQNLSLYIYGSNNLQDWKCIAASQRKNCIIANILTNRAAKAYKYFIFMIGGVVKDNTEISNIIVTLEDVANNKLR